VKLVLFHSEATAELEDAAFFYEQRRTGLGTALLEEVHHAVALIQEFPSIGAPYKKTAFRQFVLGRFPYIVFYLEMADDLWVAAVAHGRRRPGYWRHRTFKPVASEPPSR